MTTLVKKISTGIALSSTLIAVAANVAFASELTISANGADTNNLINVKNSNSTAVSQSNTTTVVNTVSTTSNSGGNEANKNTGGNVTVTSGDSTAKTTVNTKAGENVVIVGGTTSAGAGGSTGSSLIIFGNGADTHNLIDLTQSNSIALAQKNSTFVDNSIITDATSGDNEANKNTGGNVTVGGMGTGDATATTTIDTWAGFNAADVFGPCGCA